MEIGTMSAEEFAKSFAENQNQNTNQSQPPAPTVTPTSTNTPIQEVNVTKSADELAAEFAAKSNQNSDGTAKTPEQIAEETAKAAELAKNEGDKKTKLDDSFKQGLDKLFKEQKLNPYSDGTETGYLIPETFEEVLELIEDNKKSWTESSRAKDREELVNEILATKSPAWQFLIQNSELYKDPADLVPLLTAVQNQEYANSLDVKQPEDQEKIIRASLSIQGLPPQAIEDDIADLKERGKLSKRAEELKPVLDQYNSQQTSAILKEKEEQDLKNEKFWNTHFQNLENTVFKSADLDGVKLSTEHKQLIASALIPDQKLGGLPIYPMLDNLIAKGDFKLLSKVSLLLQDEETFNNYFLSKKAEQKANGIQKVLRTLGTTSTPTEGVNENKPRPLKKQSYGYFG